MIFSQTFGLWLCRKTFSMYFQVDVCFLSLNTYEPFSMFFPMFFFSGQRLVSGLSFLLSIAIGSMLRRRRFWFDVARNGQQRNVVRHRTCRTNDWFDAKYSVKDVFIRNLLFSYSTTPLTFYWFLNCVIGFWAEIVHYQSLSCPQPVIIANFFFSIFIPYPVFLSKFKPPN